MKEKAYATITRFAVAIGVDMEEKTPENSVAVSRNIMCLSCSAPIVMAFDAMVSLVIMHKEIHIVLCHVNPADTAYAQT